MRWNANRKRNHLWSSCHVRAERTVRMESVGHRTFVQRSLAKSVSRHAENIMENLPENVAHEKNNSTLSFICLRNRKEKHYISFGEIWNLDFNLYLLRIHPAVMYLLITCRVITYLYYSIERHHLFPPHSAKPHVTSEILHNVKLNAPCGVCIFYIVL